MVAILHSLTEARKSAEGKSHSAAPAFPRGGAIARLKRLHAEAEETAELANLLGRSLYAGIALPILGILTITLSVDMSPAPQLVWLGFVGVVAVSILLAYRQAMKHPFEYESLKTYAKDLSAILLFAGFAWGSGAFLALPAASSALPALFFAAVPAGIIAYLLRDRTALLLFLAPVTVLTAAACLLRPFTGSVWLAGGVLLCGLAIAGATRLYEKLTGLNSKPAMLSLP